MGVESPVKGHLKKLGTCKAAVTLKKISPFKCGLIWITNPFTDVTDRGRAATAGPLAGPVAVVPTPADVGAVRGRLVVLSNPFGIGEPGFLGKPVGELANLSPNPVASPPPFVIRINRSLIIIPFFVYL